jgi:hypothetical protein
MQARIGKIAVLIFALALAMAGCGGDDDQPALTKAEFIKQADKICKEADQARYKVIARVTKERVSQQNLQFDSETEEDILTEGLEPTQKQAEEIRDLGAPEGDEQTIEAYLESLEEAVEEAEAGTLSDLDKVKNPFNEPDELATAYGFKACREAL